MAKTLSVPQAWKVGLKAVMDDGRVFEFEGEVYGADIGDAVDDADGIIPEDAGFPDDAKGVKSLNLSIERAN